MDKFTEKCIALLMVATLGVTVVGFSAHADEANLGVATRTVRYADLNLATPAGAKVLYKRIENAAQQVCGDVDSRQMDQAAAAKACAEQAITQSIRAVNRAQLTHVAETHGHRLDATFHVAVAR